MSLIAPCTGVDELPRLVCPRRNLDAVNAGIERDLWRDIDPVYLRDAITGAPPRQLTWIKTAWDQNELRVFFHAMDTFAWATLTDHDARLYEEEVVEVYVDPAGDLESYFEIEVNPLNAVCDLVLRRTKGGYHKDFGWHCAGLITAVSKRENAWSAEISIPFRSLGSVLPEVGTIWRTNFFRIDRPAKSEWELSAWSPTGQPLFHVPRKFGFLEFVA